MPKHSRNSTLSRILTPIAVENTSPFADKILPNGSKLFKRVHGVSQQVSNSLVNIDFSIPYANCKITGMEIISAVAGDVCNFKILDTPSGTISGVANAQLNQFGFNVNIASIFYKHESNYDADLIQDLKIRIEYLPKDTSSTRDVFINLILHEVQSG